MDTTTPFLDLEARLFGCDRQALDRVASRYVLVSANVVARRRRVPTDRYPTVPKLLATRAQSGSAPVQ
jgi:hypothetical protein